jgi:Flp pilus assembly protein TadD
MVLRSFELSIFMIIITVIILSGCATDMPAMYGTGRGEDKVIDAPQQEETEIYDAAQTPQANNSSANGTKPRFDNKTGLKRIGFAAHQAGDTKTAVQVYKEALKISANDPDLNLKLANALVDNNSPREAILHYHRVLNSNPQHSQALVGMGQANLMLGNANSGIEYMYQAASLNNEATTLSSLGASYDLAGRHKEAQAVYRTALKDNPTDPDLRNNMALSLLLSGKPEDAVSILLSIIQKPNAKPRYRNNLALVYGVIGNEGAARKLLKEDLSIADVERNIESYRMIRHTMKANKNSKSLRDAILG